MSLLSLPSEQGKGLKNRDASHYRCNGEEGKGGKWMILSNARMDGGKDRNLSPTLKSDVKKRKSLIRKKSSDE